MFLNNSVIKLKLKCVIEHAGESERERARVSVCDRVEVVMNVSKLHTLVKNSYVFSNNMYFQKIRIGLNS